MSEGPTRIDALKPPCDPQNLLQARQEASIRRQISALYFAIINYWAAILYYKCKINSVELHLKLHQKKKDRDPENYVLLDLEETLTTILEDLGPKFIKISNLRVACDHYLSNPATIKRLNKNIVKIKIDTEELEKAKEAFEKIINKINTTNSNQICATILNI